MTPSKEMATKAGALFATGLVATSIFASMPSAEALDSGTFGKTISAAEAEKSFKNVPVDHSELLKAVEEAKAAGLTVNERDINKITTSSTSEVASSLNAIATNYADQAQTIRSLIDSFKADKAQAEADHKKAVEAWEADKAKVEASNAEKKAAYEKAQAEYQAKVDKAQAAVAAGECAPPRVAMTFDLSRSFDVSETATMKGQAKKMVERLSAVEGAEVSFFTFARDSAVNFQEAVADQEVPSGPVTVLPGNQPSQVFNIGTAAGKEAALAWIDGIDKHSKDAPVGTEGEAWAGVNYLTLGTNWEAALSAIEKQQASTGVKYDTALLLTDGAPNTYNLNGEVGIHSPLGAHNGSDEAFNAAKAVADRLEASGTDVIPVMIRDEAVNDPSHPFHFSSDEAGMLNYIRGISGVASPTEGHDYFVGELESLSDSIYRAATVAAAKCIVDDPKPVEPTYDQHNTPAPEPKDVPAPVATYQLAELSAPVPVVEKIAVDEGKKVLAGETTTQTISYATGYEAPAKFVIGDHIYKTEDGRVPVSIDMSKVAVTDAEGNTEQYRTKLYCLVLYSGATQQAGNYLHFYQKMRSMNLALLGTNSSRSFLSYGGWI